MRWLQGADLLVQTKLFSVSRFARWVPLPGEEQEVSVAVTLLQRPSRDLTEHDQEEFQLDTSAPFRNDWRRQNERSYLLFVSFTTVQLYRATMTASPRTKRCERQRSSATRLQRSRRKQSRWLAGAARPLTIEPRRKHGLTPCDQRRMQRVRCITRNLQRCLFVLLDRQLRSLEAVCH